MLFKSPLVKQQVSILTQQVNHAGLVQEFMKSYEVVISHPHGYLLQKSNILRGENTVLKE